MGENGHAMIAVIFEVWPADRDRYLDIAAELYPLLVKIDGFISIERFQSLTETGKILSLSFWRDGEAVKAWRTQPEHGLAQQEGRHGVFRDYRLRVAHVARDYGLNDRKDVPADLQKNG
jgi:heme-degrading monooxygenase HmoA